MSLLVPVAITGLIGAAAWKTWGPKKGMTPKRRKVYESAMKSLSDPVKLRKLADVFDKEGCKHEAGNLRKKADNMELPPDVKKARRQAYKKALKSKDPVAVEKMANAFQTQGSPGAAASLRKYAAGLKSH